MYKENILSTILIVKTSSLGDIIQAFSVLDYLKTKFPGVAIDWVVEEAFAPLVSAHPHIRKAISVHLKEMKKGWWKFLSWRHLKASISQVRSVSYDLVFDLQGNCKSGVITAFSRAKHKVGFGYRSVREKPNILFTHTRFEIPKQMNIRKQHLSLVQRFFRDSSPFSSQGGRLKIPEGELQTVQEILKDRFLQTPLRIMVCPGSKWVNKQLPSDTWIAFLKKVKVAYNASFLLIWGSEAEKAHCQKIHESLPERSSVVERLPITTWQNLMSEVDLVIAVDSSALHLCGTTQTPSFSLFGPTSSDIFRPLGDSHFSFQGKCPYGKTFDKTCPVLRTCRTGACIRNLKADEIFDAFSKNIAEILKIDLFRKRSNF